MGLETLVVDQQAVLHGAQKSYASDKLRLTAVHYTLMRPQREARGHRAVCRIHLRHAYEGMQA